MKKSNKLLLVGFLTLLLIFTAIHVALYAKYKAGDYTIFNADEDLAQLSMQQFPNILFVSVRNLPGGTIKFSEVAQVKKVEEDKIQYTRKGDTLQITGPSNPGEFRRPSTIYLPYNATLFLQNSALSFEAGKEGFSNNPTIYLQQSNVIFQGQQPPLSLGHLRLFASDRSMVLFQGNTQVSHLETTLSNSQFEVTDSNFGQLSIVTDSLSRISLPSKQLLKATISTGPTE